MTERLDKIERIVTRKGTRVEIVHTIGSRMSRPIVYELLTQARARAFVKHTKLMTGEYPAMISQKWGDYLVDETSASEIPDPVQS